MPTAKEMITRARAALILDHPFWASLALRLELVEAEAINFGPVSVAVPTATTDGKRMYYNPKFIESLKPQEVLFIVAHETGHNVFQHPQRLGDREPRKANIAMDLALNPILVDAGFSMPEGCLLEKKFKDMTWEEIYTKIKVEEIKMGAGSDPGGCGEAIKPRNNEGKELSQSEMSQLESEWKVAVAQAAQQAKMMGRLPAGLARLIDEVLEPVVDWKEILRRFVEDACKNDYRWFPPNRKYIHQGLYLPSMRSDELLNIVVAVDTSGSIGKTELDQFSAEITSILEVFQANCTVIYCDADVANVEEFSSQDLPITLNPKGGGGTDFNPVFRYLAEKGIAPACLIYLTDLCGTYPKEAPEYPVLWAQMGDYDDKVPFGEVIKLI